MKFKGMTFKKRYLVIGLVLAELASIPVSAQIIDKVVFSAAQKVVSVPFPPEPGLTTFMVSSNAPFAITSENAIGEFTVDVQVEGSVNGNRFGGNAQLPGERHSCAAQTSPLTTKLYEATRKTAAEKGDIVSQAVVISVSYDPALTPDFKIITEKKAKGLPLGSNCESTLS